MWVTNVNASWEFWSSGSLRCLAGVNRSLTVLVYRVPSKLLDLSADRHGILNGSAAETSVPANAGLFCCRGCVKVDLWRC
jgi:hypothetical protein